MLNLCDDEFVKIFRHGTKEIGIQVVRPNSSGTELIPLLFVNKEYFAEVFAETVQYIQSDLNNPYLFGG